MVNRMIGKIKKRIFDVIQIGNRSDLPSRLFDYFIVFVIVLNLAVTFCATFDELEKYFRLFGIVEFATIVVFTVEYILRILTADLLYPGKSFWKAVCSFVFSFNGLIDLLVFLPFYLPFFFPVGIVAFRLFRVLRIFRLFKINAQYDAFHVITDVLKEKKLQIISSCCMIFILVLAASMAMYSVEKQAQPENFKNAFSGIWWAVSTVLTIGYGDISPQTPAGWILGIFVAFLGVGMVAIPTGIISAGFVEEYTKIKTYKGSEHELQFVVSEVIEGHPWANKMVRDIVFPPELILAMIIRKGESLIPKGDTFLYKDDKLVIGAKNYRDDIDISLKEIKVEEGNPWIGMRVRDLEIPKEELLLMITRRNKTLVPNGNTVIRQDDGIVILIK